ncbi:MAG: hypothetical protein ACOCTI_04665 [Phycisphaeraceae bacterium]
MNYLFAALGLGALCAVWSVVQRLSGQELHRCASHKRDKAH